MTTTPRKGTAMTQIFSMTDYPQTNCPWCQQGPFKLTKAGEFRVHKIGGRHCPGSGNVPAAFDYAAVDAKYRKADADVADAFLRLRDDTSA